MLARVVRKLIDILQLINDDMSTNASSAASSWDRGDHDSSPLTPAAWAAIDAIHDAIKKTKETVDATANASLVSTVVLATRHHNNLKTATTELAMALDMLPLAALGRRRDERADEVKQLVADLRNAQFEQTGQLLAETAQLRRQVDIGFHQGQQDNEEVKRLLVELLVRVQQLDGSERDTSAASTTASASRDEGVSAVLDVKDRAKLQVELADAREKKERLEAYWLEQVIAGIAALEEEEKARRAASAGDDDDDDGAASTGSGSSGSSVLELPRSFFCPISGELMEEPCIVAETGTTYERSAIEEWFARGHRRDPVTNVELSSTKLIPNYALKNHAQFLTMAPLSAGVTVYRERLRRPSGMIQVRWATTCLP